MKNYLDIPGYSFSLMYIEPKLEEAHYLNLPIGREDFKRQMSYYEDEGKGLKFIPVLDTLTFKDPECVGLKREYQYEDLSELNLLAYLISELDDSELNIFKAILSYGMGLAGEDDKLRWLINLTENTVNYEYYPCVFSLYDLGKNKLLQSFSATSFPDDLEDVLELFDFTEMGARFLKHMKGHLFTPGGFIEVLHDEPWKMVYTGKLDEIPEEYQLTEYMGTYISPRMNSGVFLLQLLE